MFDARAFAGAGFFYSGKWFVLTLKRTQSLSSNEVTVLVGNCFLIKLFFIKKYFGNYVLGVFVIYFMPLCIFIH